LNIAIPENEDFKAFLINIFEADSPIIFGLEEGGYLIVEEEAISAATPFLQVP
jgi:hypothetical protein